ncbi:ferritin family protein [Geoglobus sp.]
MTPEEILEKAKRMEHDAIKTYLELKKDADTETSELLEFLISQEREHLQMINDRLKALRILKK